MLTDSRSSLFSHAIRRFQGFQNSLREIGSQQKKLWKFVRPYSRTLVIATILASISAPIGLLLPLLTGRIIDAALLPGGLAHLRQIVLLFIGLCGVLGVLTYASNYLINSIGVYVLRDLRSSLFSHAIRLSQDFHDSLRTGDLLSRISSDLTVIQAFLTGTIPSGIPAVISFFCVTTLLFVIHVKLALLSIIVIPPAGVVSMVIGRMMRDLSTEQQNALANSTAFAEEKINGIRTVQSAGREFLEINHYFDKLGTLLRVQLKNIRWGSTVTALVRTMQLTSTVLVLWYGGYLIISHELSPGQLVAFMLLCSAGGG